MASTYDAALPTLKDHARFLLGDNIVSVVKTPGTPQTVLNPLLDDGEIVTMLSTYTFSQAIMNLCDGLISFAGQQVTHYSITGGVSMQWADRMRAWSTLRKTAEEGRLFTPIQHRRSNAVIGRMRWNAGRWRSD